MNTHHKHIRSRRTLFLAMIALAVGVILLASLLKWLLHDRNFVVTDNAFVAGNLIPVYADATGLVTQVLIEETQNVNKGDLLLRLDEQRAGAALAQAESELARAVRSVSAQFASRRQACQKIAARTAQREKIRHDIARYRAAASNGSVSQQTLQNAEDQLAALDADLRETRAEAQAVEARVGGVTRLNHPDVEVAKAKFNEAYIEFARQRVRAPVSGYVAKRKAQIGDRVRPGDQLLTIVPLDHLWIEANLWENRMERVRPGQPATITVDLYGGSETFHGTVEGVAAGSGSVFALMPPDNATGNFIHIVQRVPVRIALRAEETDRQPLRPGLSSVVTIDVSDAQRSPKDSAARPATAEYSTDIYDGDLAAAKARAEQIVKDNAPSRGDSLEAPCTTD